MKLADYFRTLCAEHDLKSISVDFHIYGAGHCGFGAYAHWNDAVGRCAYGGGDTPEIAIATAVEQANAIRGPGVELPDAIEVEDVA